MTDPDLLFTAKIRNLTENELVVFFVCSVFYQIIFRERRMYACQMEKIKSGIICVVKNIGKGHRNPFPKSAQTTKKC